jgi:hypothetical protein
MLDGMAKGLRVTVTDEATRLEDEGDKITGEQVALYNRGTGSVFLGGADVTAAAGFELGAGESITLLLTFAEQEIYAITASGTQRVDVLVL